MKDGHIVAPEKEAQGHASQYISQRTEDTYTTSNPPTSHLTQHRRSTNNEYQQLTLRNALRV